MDHLYTLPYCVYAHFIDGVLIYIGSGETCRAFNIRSRTQKYAEMVEHGNLSVTILSRHADRNEAFDHEARMIAACMPPANTMHIKPMKQAALGVTHKPSKQKMRRRKATTALVLQTLTDAAQTGAPCPTNAQIGRVIGTQPASVSGLIREMAKRGDLEVILHEQGRQIRIGEHLTAPTANPNVPGVATVRARGRERDWIVV